MRLAIARAEVDALRELDERNKERIAELERRAAPDDAAAAEG
ncbi:hypothetical protein [Georgenia sp. MJ170]